MHRIGKMDDDTVHTCNISARPTAHGYEYVMFAKDLSRADRQLIEKYYTLKPHEIIQVLIHNNEACGRQVFYSTTVVSNVRRQHIQHLAGGPASFDKFLSDGCQINQEGGLFYHQHDGNGHFARAVIQPAMCKRIAELCGDYVQVDGTFCMCYDGKVLLALVDGLNRSVPAGFALIESENSSVSFRILV